jgi:hypothetical protein
MNKKTPITIQSKPYDQTHIWNILLAIFFNFQLKKLILCLVMSVK